METEFEVNAETKRSFFSFASDFFCNSDVQDACLTLYDKYQTNANVLMLCCWLARESYEQLTVSDIAAILYRVKRWGEDVLEPLWHMCDRLRPFRHTNRFAALHRSILESLDYAAQVERSMLLDQLRYLKKQENQKNSQLNFALANIFRYLETLQISLHKTDLEKIYRITSQAV